MLRLQALLRLLRTADTGRRCSLPPFQLLRRHKERVHRPTRHFPKCQMRWRPVDHLSFFHDRKLRHVNWNSVASVNSLRREIGKQFRARRRFETTGLQKSVNGLQKVARRLIFDGLFGKDVRFGVSFSENSVSILILLLILGGRQFDALDFVLIEEYKTPRRVDRGSRPGQNLNDLLITGPV